jgi:hypothetical protein
MLWDPSTEGRLTILPRRLPAIRPIGEVGAVTLRYAAARDRVEADEAMQRRLVQQTLTLNASSLRHAAAVVLSRLARGQQLPQAAEGTLLHEELLQRDDASTANEEDLGGTVGKVNDVAPATMSLRRKRAQKSAAAWNANQRVEPADNALIAVSGDAATTSVERSSGEEISNVLQRRLMAIERNVLLFDASNIMSGEALQACHVLEQLKREFDEKLLVLRRKWMTLVAAQLEESKIATAVVTLQSCGRGHLERSSASGELGSSRSRRRLLRRLMAVCAGYVCRRKLAVDFSAELRQRRRERAAVVIQTCWRGHQQRERYLEHKAQSRAVAVLVRCLRQWVTESRRRQVLTLYRLSELELRQRWVSTSLFQDEGKERSSVIVNEETERNLFLDHFNRIANFIDRRLVITCFLQQSGLASGAAKPFQRPWSLHPHASTALVLEPAPDFRAAPRRAQSASLIVAPTDALRRAQLRKTDVSLSESIARSQLEVEWVLSFASFEGFHTRFLYRHRVVRADADKVEGHPSLSSEVCNYWRQLSKIAEGRLPPKPKKETLMERLQKKGYPTPEVSAVTLLVEDPEPEKSEDTPALQADPVVASPDDAMDDATQTVKGDAVARIQRRYRQLRASGEVDQLVAKERGRIAITNFYTLLLQRVGRGTLERRKTVRLGTLSK